MPTNASSNIYLATTDSTTFLALFAFVPILGIAGLVAQYISTKPSANNNTHRVRDGVNKPRRTGQRETDFSAIKLDKELRKRRGNSLNPAIIKILIDIAETASHVVSNLVKLRRKLRQLTTSRKRHVPRDRLLCSKGKHRSKFQWCMALRGCHRP